MGSSLNRLISLFLFLSSVIFQQTFYVQGRHISDPNAVAKEQELKERLLIGSRPPRCEGRCTKCGHCEAVQLPIVPQKGFLKSHLIPYSRGDSLSNYKPMTWKCKCGDSIFNP